MGGLVWLASYPKSGNTWVRALITNYLQDAGRPASINALVGVVASNRDLFDRHAGIEASELTGDEIITARRQMFRSLAAGGGTTYVKIHDAFSAGAFAVDGARAIYIVRNPLDVVPSLASFLGVDVDTAVERMCRETTMTTAPDRLGKHLPTRLSSWSGHVASWLDDSGLSPHVVRYEDLMTAAVPALLDLVGALGLPADAARAERAVGWSSFAELQQQEDADGFTERPAGVHRFFRRGTTGEGREQLTAAHRHRMIETHGTTMQRLGYEVAEP